MPVFWKAGPQREEISSPIKYLSMCNFSYIITTGNLCRC